MGFKDLCAGLCCGLSCLGSGYAIGIVGDIGVRCSGRQDKLFVVLVLMMIFGEALGLYGLIVALVIGTAGE